MKKLLLSLTALFMCFIVSASAFAENFYIETYRSDLRVDKQKLVKVSEFLHTNFYNEAHGIYRNIPYQRGSSVSEIFASYNPGEQWYREYTVSDNPMNREYMIKIGNPSQTVLGNVMYQIEYNYQIGDKKDNLNFNIIGTGWGTNINKAVFTIVMPGSVDEKKVKFYVGKSGAKNSDGRIKYSVENHKYGDDRSFIAAEITQPLAPHEGVTVDIEVPKGYFNIHKNIFDYIGDCIEYIMLAFMLLLTYGAYRI